MWLTTRPISDSLSPQGSPKSPRHQELPPQPHQAHLIPPSPIPPRACCVQPPPQSACYSDVELVRLLPLPSVGPIMNHTRLCRRAVDRGRGTNVTPSSAHAMGWAEGSVMNMPCSSCLFEVVIGWRWQVEGWARGLNLKLVGGRTRTGGFWSCLP